MHTFNPSAPEAEAGGSQILGQLRLFTETLCLKKGGKNGASLLGHGSLKAEPLCAVYFSPFADSRNQDPSK